MPRTKIYSDESVANIIGKYRAFADLAADEKKKGNDVPVEMEADALEEVADLMEMLAMRSGIQLTDRAHA